ncbi:MAG: hypothetical protein QXQ48_00400 [Nitrososphaerota archaeon]
MTVIFYGYNRCKTSREVEKALRKHGVELRFIDILSEPPSREVLTDLFKKYGIEGIVRRGKEDAKKVFEAWGLDGLLESLRREPRRLIRPIVIKGGEIYAGKDALSIIRPKNRGAGEE